MTAGVGVGLGVDSSVSESGFPMVSASCFLTAASSASNSPLVFLLVLIFLALDRGEPKLFFLARENFLSFVLHSLMNHWKVNMSGHVSLSGLPIQVDCKK